MEAFLLGLSTGIVCITYCGPVVIPYLLSESKSVRQNIPDILLFLGARLVAYIIIGILANLLGFLFFQTQSFKAIFVGSGYIVLSVFLIIYVFYRFRHPCPSKSRNKLVRKYGDHWSFIIPVIGGLVTGLNICPPFLLAITQAAAESSMYNSVLFFVLFFLGTSVYFVPLPFIGLLHRQQVLKVIGKFAAGLVGVIYLYKGIFLILSIYSK